MLYITQQESELNRYEWGEKAQFCGSAKKSTIKLRYSVH